MIHPDGGIFFFKVNGQDDWKLIGCDLAQHDECQSIRTSEIPKHWQELYYGSLRNDSKVLSLEIDGISKCMEQLCILACCKELKVLLDWNDFPFCMRRMHISVSHLDMMMQEFAFLFDKQRKFSELIHKQVAIEVYIRNTPIMPVKVRNLINDNFVAEEKKHQADINCSFRLSCA